jgi:hypothetical protein
MNTGCADSLERDNVRCIFEELHNLYSSRSIIRIIK